MTTLATRMKTCACTFRFRLGLALLGATPVALAQVTALVSSSRWLPPISGVAG